VPTPRRRKSVFLNIPYDQAFEDLYIAYVVGLTQLGLTVNVTLALPNEGRLDAIIELIEASDLSIHDLSRVELSRGLPRFNMPLELGLALYRARMTRGKHHISIFDRKPYQVQRSTSDVNAIDPQIHHGSPRHLMIALRNIFRQPGDVTTVPEMLASYRALKRKLPEIRKNAGGGSLFGAAVFEDIVLASLVEAQTRRERRR
jgi:hypothetical protein